MKPLPRKFESMGAERVLKLLEGIHTQDVFVSECKNGPTQAGSHSRMDAWVMNRSWSRLCFTGYEIKVSRSDFNQDKKWHAYLPLCNQLYFVCPKGMIEPSEVPFGVGLKYATNNRILIAKKAQHRDVRPPMELFCYILMCRSKITSPSYFQPETREQKLQKYKDWLAQKEENRSLGDILKFSIARQIDWIKDQNKVLKEENEKYAELKKFCQNLGISKYDYEERIKEKIENFQKAVPPGFEDALKNFEKSLAELREKSGIAPGRSISGVGDKLKS